jgi:hypothetical protein
MVKRRHSKATSRDRATIHGRSRLARIILGLAGCCCLLTALPAMAAQKQLATGLVDRSPEGREVRRAQWSGIPIDLSMSSVNPLVHHLDSGLKFRGIKLFDRFYLARQKRGSNNPARTLGISYADDDILYYFSPELLSISLRY